MLTIPYIKLIPFVVYFSKLFGNDVDFCSEESEFLMKAFKNYILMNKAAINQTFQESCTKFHNPYYSEISYQDCIDQGLKHHEFLIENIVKDSEFSSKICPFGNSVLDYANSSEDCEPCGSLVESMDNFANWVIKKTEGFCNDFEHCKDVARKLMNSWYDYLTTTDELDKCLRICPIEDNNKKYEYLTYPEDNVDGNGLDYEY